MSTPERTTVCPGCNSTCDAGTNFCGHCGADLRREADGNTDQWLGRLVDSRYRVLAKIGQGGMGVVYKVEHQRMGKIAAMKVLHRELTSDREVVKRFRREAEAVSKLTHPNTVQVFDFGTADGALYLVMEHVRGEEMSAILSRDGSLPFQRAAPLFAQICGALAEAHELGIVHRDLKPENILITRTQDGQDHIKVLDFGLAKLSEREELAEVTGRGTIIGTPYYMSPEQIRGEPLDHRSDIYSLGAMLYRTVTGVHPFEASTPVAVLTKHLTEELVPPHQRRPDLAIDPLVETIILRSMAKRADRRYANVGQMREEIEHGREELASAAFTARVPSSPRASRDLLAALRPGSERRRHENTDGKLPLLREDFDSFEQSLRRRNWLAIIVIPAILIVALGSGVAYSLWRKGRPHSEEVEPNNEIQKATRIAAGSPVTGHIGKRLGPSSSDKDFFFLARTPSGQIERVSANLEGIRNMDLALVVYDRGGGHLETVDNGGIGEGEIMPNLAVRDKELFILVMESKEVVRERGPTENITDSYKLEVEVVPLSPDEEIEPNALALDATAIAVDKPMRGFLGRLHDVDLFRFQGAPGTYSLAIAGAELAPMRIRIGRITSMTTRQELVVLDKGDLIEVARDDEGLAKSHPAALDTPYTIAISSP